MVMSAVNYGEAYARILHDHGEMGAELVWSVVRALPMELVDATPQRAIRAAEIKIQYKLYYADSFAAALALEHKATLVTSDSDFRKSGHGAGVVWLKT
jgi:predicted nucleic acid-binding protein